VCLSDKTVVGGLNLLLMAGLHTGTITTSSLLTVADNTKHSAAGSQDRCMQQPHQVTDALSACLVDVATSTNHISCSSLLVAVSC